jgi:tetratricopeptide (TPR) repeat protein
LRLAVSRATDNSQLDRSITHAQIYVQAEEAAVEDLLVAIIKQCDRDTGKLAVQRLKAWAELLKLYQKLDRVTVSVASFQEAMTVFNAVIANYPWGEQSSTRIESFELAKALLELAFTFMKSGFTDEARRMLRRAATQAETAFGSEDERTIWVLIQIGLVYQKLKGWDAASEWFDAALNAAMKMYDEDDGIRISLEEAKKVRHFSYINDDGRPYKTIFGVCGLTIRPLQLHIE